MDRQYLKTPFYGSRKMKAWLLQQGYLVSRKRVRRLMRLMVSRVNHICQFSVNQFCRFTSSAWPRCWAASVR